MNDAILLKVTYTKKKKIIFKEDRLSKFSYRMFVTNGITLKVTYTIKFYAT